MHSDFLIRVRILRFIFLGVFVVFVLRLFDLQVLKHEEFYAEAKAQHEKRSILPAQRGNILVRKNRLTEETTPLATNNTLKMLFVDPIILAYPSYNPNLDFMDQEKGNPGLAAELLAPLLIHAHCEKIEGCEIETEASKWTEAERTAIDNYRLELEKIFSEIERRRVVLATEVAESRLKTVQDLRLPGIWLEDTSIVADPTRIDSIDHTTEQISPLLNIDERKLKNLLARRPKRYVEITNKIVPEVAEKILELKNNPRYSSTLRGIQLRDEHWRYYPERELAAQVLGFVDSSNKGQYGIEGRFDQELAGQEGVIFGATNTRGQRILGKGSEILRARDGADVLISIDRVIQGRVESILEEDVKRFDADFGQVIVIEPKTGRILAMAQAPSFDPNEFGKAFLRYEVTPEQEAQDREDENFNQRIPTAVDRGRYYRYFNKWGPEVFRNKIISDVYEPGSVVKALTMAAALNSDEVTPQTTFNDTGPIEVDEFEIRNADEKYEGITTMVEVINRSLNTGIAFITRKMGAKLLYEYLTNFGFGQYTDVELDGEADGQLEFWKDWEESELVTRGFGQGMTSTALQMAMAFASLANGGYLMKPILVEEVRYPDGNVKKFHSEKIRKVISDETYNKIKAILLNSVSNGIARGAKVWGYSVMGKTGTSQTYKHGQALEGEGTTITSFAGFGPFDDPAFVILVKFDRPRSSQWGSETAAGTFRKVAEFLFQHLGIPPDK
ncbi:penicillin-binding protein 2 [Candidatus Gracilibacteria bacterium]|nr:penicillin-binding protein 2 [Candidatus Gracilibacteria bacterium]